MNTYPDTSAGSHSDHGALVLGIGQGDKECSISTPPSIHSSSGIGTSDSSGVSPAESNEIDESDSQSNLNLLMLGEQQKSDMLGSSLGSNNEDSRFSTISEKQVPSNLNLSDTSQTPMFSGSLDSFISNSLTNKMDVPNDLDQLAGKRSRSKSQDKGDKKVKRTKPLNTVASKKAGKPVTGSKSDSTNTSSANALSHTNFHNFGGSPFFDCPLSNFGQTGQSGLNTTLQSTRTNDAVCGNSPSSNNLIAPPKVFPSLSDSSPAKDSHSGDFPVNLEQLLEIQWEQSAEFLMQQGQHFDVASLLNCLHQLKSENQRLEESVRNLSTRRDHLLSVNARLALPFTTVNNVCQNTVTVSDSSQDYIKPLNDSLVQDLSASHNSSSGRNSANKSPGVSTHSSPSTSSHVQNISPAIITSTSPVNIPSSNTYISPYMVSHSAINVGSLPLATVSIPAPEPLMSHNSTLGSQAMDSSATDKT